MCIRDRHGHWHIVAHRAERLHAVAGHRGQDHAQVFEGVAEGVLPFGDGFVVGGVLVAGVGQCFQRAQVLGQPRAVGPGGGDALLQFVVGDDAPGDGVHQQHPPRLQPPLVQHALRGHVEHADLRGHDHPVIVGNGVARWP